MINLKTEYQRNREPIGESLDDEGGEFSPEIFMVKYTGKLEQGIMQPLGGDPFASYSCAGLLEFIQEEPEMLKLITEARAQRGPSPTTEIMNLSTAHGLNYIMTFMAKIEDYPYTLELYNPTSWKEKVYREIYRNYQSEYSLLLATMHANTNIPNRGVYLPFVLHSAFPAKRLTVVDAGASTNGILGKMAWNGQAQKDDPYIIHSDSTYYQGKEGIIKQFVHAPVDFFGVGFDINMFDSEESRAWVLVNDYIKNMNSEYLARKKMLTERYQNASNISFFQGDMCDSHFIPGSIDYINHSATLYELPKIQRDKAMERAFEAVDPENGLVGVADRIVVENGELVFTKDRGPGSYGFAIKGKRTGNRWINPLRMADSTCEEFEPGPDWNEYVSIFLDQNNHCQQILNQV